MVKESLWHAERGRYRAVTGANSLFPNEDGVPTSYAPFPTKGTIPVAKTKTGTIQSTGVNVRGTGTLFRSEIEEGDYLYNGDAAVRKVLHIISDTLLVLEKGFASDVAALTALKVCKPQWAKEIDAKSTGTAAAILQETPFRVNDEDLCGGAPLAYDASATNAEISFSIAK